MNIAIYARVSTEKQEKQETIQSQLGALRNYVVDQKYSLTKEYIDEGYSGELLARPALDNLRDDAKNKLFEAVLIHSPDRLSRKFIYLGLVEEEFKKYNVRMIFLNRPDSKDTPEENLLTGIQGLIAEFEKAKILERTRRGRLHKVKNGIIVGSIPPFGYRYIKNDRDKNIPGHYVIEESEAIIVRLIFDLFVNQKMSIRSIAKELTKRNIPPRQGIHWRTSSLNRIIRNETYTGVTYYNKHASCEAKTHRNNQKYRRTKFTGRKLRPKDQWMPIKLPDDLKLIDKEIFLLAQQQFKTNSNHSPRNVKYQYLLRGLVKCAYCGSPFHGTPCHGKYYYRCGNRNRSFPLPRECRKASMVKADALETLVWDSFCQMIRNPQLILDQLDSLRENATKANGNTEEELKSLDTKLASMSQEENRLLDAYRESIITIDQLKSQMSKIKDRIAELTQKRQAILEGQNKTQTTNFSKDNLYQLCALLDANLKKIEKSFEAKRNLMTLAINSITLEGKTVRIKSIIPPLPENAGLYTDGSGTPNTNQPESALLRTQLPFNRTTWQREDHAGTKAPDHPSGYDFYRSPRNNQNLFRHGAPKFS